MIHKRVIEELEYLRECEAESEETDYLLQRAISAALAGGVLNPIERAGLSKAMHDHATTDSIAEDAMMRKWWNTAMVHLGLLECYVAEDWAMATRKPKTCRVEGVLYVAAI